MPTRTLAAVALACALARIDALLIPARMPAARLLAPTTCSRHGSIILCDEAAAEPLAADEAESTPAAEAEAAPAAGAEAAPADAPEVVAQAVAPEDSPAPRRRPKDESRTAIEELEVGSTVEGTVRSVQSYGAFVNVGATTDGLLHVSEMSDSFVKDATEMFKTGDKVSVRIKSVNLEKGQVALSCKSENAEGQQRRAPRERKARPDLSEFESADPTVFLTGKVNSITSYGAFVTLKEGVDGLVHISAVSEERCDKVEDVLSEGQEVQVRVVSFDPSKRRIGLSMKPYVENEEQQGGRQRGRRDRGSRGGMGDDDSEFKMTAEELAAMGVDFEERGDATSVFAQAVLRAQEVKEAKAAKKKYERVVL